jgi:hypothetical protein
VKSGIKNNTNNIMGSAKRTLSFIPDQFSLAYLDPGAVEDHVTVGELRSQVFSIELLAVLVPLHTVQL